MNCSLSHIVTFIHQITSIIQIDNHLSSTRGKGLKPLFVRLLNVAAEQVAEKRTISVIPSEARNLSFFIFLQLNRREIPRFARNDRLKYFFRSLFSL
jgi:hypothetical protein